MCDGGRQPGGAMPSAGRCRNAAAAPGSGVCHGDGAAVTPRCCAVTPQAGCQRGPAGRMGVCRAPGRRQPAGAAPAATPRGTEGG